MIRRGIRRAFRLAPRRDAQLDEQVDDEIQLHLELRTAQLVRAGLAPDAARAEALRRFGPLDRNRRVLRRTAAHREQRMRLREQLESLWYDLRHAARALRRDRALATVVVVTLALGIGATASMFGVIDRLLLTGPAHVRDAAGLRRLYVSSNPTGMKENTGTSFGYVMLTRLREHGTTFAGVAAYTGSREEVLGRGLGAQPVHVDYVSASLFPLLGVQPVLGRFFVEADERPPQGQPVAVIGHGLWRRRFGADSGVLGRTLRMGERTFTIVGVAPRGFTGATLAPVDVWLPISASLSGTDDWATTHGVTWLRIVARLAPGASEAQAGAQATALFRAEFAERDAAPSVRLSLRPIWYDGHGVEAPEVAVSRWLIGVSVVLLLIACANVANLLLARGLRRRREIAVRLALGVGRARLVRLLMTEGALLALAGGVAGVAVAYVGGWLLRRTLLDAFAWDGSPVSLRVLACAAAATLATALLVGLLPALRASEPRLTLALANGTPQSGARRSALRATLTVTQGALSAVLLVGAGLFVHSLWSVHRLDIGLEPERLLTVTMQWPDLPDDTEAEQAAAAQRRRALQDAALERLRALPGVARVAAGWGTPFNSSYWAYPVVPGYDSLPKLPGGGPYYTGVTEDYFATMGTSIVRGRGIEAGDVKGSAPVAVVNETMARTLWPAGDAIGQCFRAQTRDSTCVRVVGIAEDVPHWELREEPSMHFYVAARQGGGSLGVVLVRAREDPAALVPAVRRAVQELEPSLVYVDVAPLADELAPQLRPWRLGASLFALFGALALAVAGVGLYSVMSYAAASRTREMGVRLALGAQAADVRALVLRHGLALGVSGVLLGALLALVAGRWVAPLLFATSPREPLVFVAVTATLLATAVVASLVPAWRAGRTPPSVALRME
ncbi:MAG TPA: ADOP family duplicated permease [Gemmatimonadaceae bacterium]|nr:ADOP family duplicated permease [Gemmatimonadaceae bacterium]